MQKLQYESNLDLKATGKGGTDDVKNSRSISIIIHENSKSVTDFKVTSKGVDGADPS